MAKTPEVKVKDEVKKILKEHGAYYAMPVASGYGNVGVPDILACYRGTFIAIECKAGRGKPTALQLANLSKIAAAGGIALIINETNMQALTDAITGINQGEIV